MSSIRHYACSSCNCVISIGCYHGTEPGVWFNSLYCRHCATDYTLRQTTKQFMAGFGNKKTAPKTRKYEIRGPSTIQYVVVGKHLPSPTLTCEVCKAQGPFGSQGPLTDQAPEGIDPYRSFPFPNNAAEAAELKRLMAQEQIGKCPKCHQQTMRYTSETII